MYSISLWDLLFAVEVRQLKERLTKKGMDIGTDIKSTAFTVLAAVTAALSKEEKELLEKKEISLSQKGEELIVKAGHVKRTIILSRTLLNYMIEEA